MPSALDRLNAYVAHDTDEDAAEFARRVAAYRAEVLNETAQVLNARHCCPESVALARRLIDERLCTDCKGWGQTVSLDQDGGVVRRCRSCNREGLHRVASEPTIAPAP